MNAEVSDTTALAARRRVGVIDVNAISLPTPHVATRGRYTTTDVGGGDRRRYSFVAPCVASSTSSMGEPVEGSRPGGEVVPAVSTVTVRRDVPGHTPFLAQSCSPTPGF